MSETVAKFKLDEKVMHYKWREVLIVKAFEGADDYPLVMVINPKNPVLPAWLTPDVLVPYVGSPEYYRDNGAEEIARLQAELVTERQARQAVEAQLETLRAKLHEAVKPYIAGGSEYTGDSGLVRAIEAIGDTAKTVAQQVIKRKEAEAQLAALVEAAQPFLEYEQRGLTLTVPVIKAQNALAAAVTKAKGADHE